MGRKVYTKVKKKLSFFFSFEVDDQFNSRLHSSLCVFLSCFAMYKDRQPKLIPRASIQNNELPVTEGSEMMYSLKQ